MKPISERIAELISFAHGNGLLSPEEVLLTFVLPRELYDDIEPGSVASKLITVAKIMGQPTPPYPDSVGLFFEINRATGSILEMSALGCDDLPRGELLGIMGNISKQMMRAVAIMSSPINSGKVN